jgi:hypothetical protein
VSTKDASEQPTRRQPRDFAQQRADKLAREYFKERGIRSVDQKTMQLRVLSEDETVERFQFAYPSILIPYPNPDKASASSQFERARFLPNLAGEVPKQKYTQPSKTPPRAYFPALLDWPTIFKDIGATLIITEGEFKSYRACKEGYNCVGIGGVFSFQNKARLKPLIRDLAQFDYKNRKVLLVFDSDADTNPFVAMAEERLARELVRRGAKIGIVRLPATENGAKQGVDDFLEQSGMQALDALIEDAFDTGIAANFTNLNRDYAVLHKLARIIEIETGDIFTYHDFKNIIGAKYNETVISDSGQPKVVDNIKLWLASEAHNEVQEIVFDPNSKFPYAKIDDQTRNYNLFRGWPVVERGGDVSAWDEFLGLLFQGRPDLRKWFECWVAYPIQFPATKLYTSVILVSRKEGVGKSLVCELIDAQYGPYATVVGAADLHSPFNSYAKAKLFVHAEEATPSKQDVNHLKHLITGETIQIEEKFKTRYPTRNVLNLILNTNHADALTLSDEDRRFFVVKPGAAPDATLVERLKRLKETPEGIAALRWHLLKEVDVRKFDPRGRAPMTDAKADMIALSSSDMQSIVDELKDDPRAKLTLKYFPVMNTTEIGIALVSSLGRPSLAKGELKELGLALYEAEFKKVTVRSRDNKRSQKLWVLDTKWADALTTYEIYKLWATKRSLGVVAKEAIDAMRPVESPEKTNRKF